MPTLEVDTFYVRLHLDLVVYNGYSFTLTNAELPAACIRVIACMFLDSFCEGGKPFSQRLVNRSAHV